MTNRVFAPVRKGGRARAGAKRKAKRGTRFRYTLSEPARVRITIERRRRCPKNRKPRRCKRFKRVTTLVANERAGRQSTAFSGRVRRRAVKPGRFRARLVANDALGARSRERRVAFRIVRR